MFGFLKQKLKDAISKFSKDVKKESEEVIVEKEEPKVEEQKEPIKEIKEEKKEKIIKQLAVEKAKEPKAEISKKTEPIVEEPIKEEKKGFFSKIKDTFSFKKKEAEEELTVEKQKEQPKLQTEKNIEAEVFEVKEPQVTIKKEKPHVVKVEEEKRVEKPKIETKTEKPKEAVKEKETKHDKIEKAHKQPEKVVVKDEKKPEPTTIHVPKVEKIEEKIIPILEKPVVVQKKHPIIVEAKKKEEPKLIKEQKKEPFVIQKIEPKIEIKEKFIEKTKSAEKEIEAEEKKEDIEEKEAGEEIKHHTPQKTIQVIEEKLKEEKKGFFDKVKETFTKTTLSEEKFNEIFWELEIVFLENNVAVEVIEKIKSDLKEELVNQKVHRGKIEEVIIETLEKSINGLFDIKEIDLLKNIKQKKPYIIMFIGVNGSGKTTNLAKVAKYLQDHGLKCVIAACDTFRAAAIQQIENHANNLGIKLVKQDYGADSAAVAFDAISHAKSRGYDVVLIDTAGRSHSNANLMDELKKVERVAKPDLTIFVGDSLTGNDVVEQAKSFGEKIGFGGIILAKADIDEKGGAAISVSYVTGKPIIFIGTGQDYKDLKRFDKSFVMNNLGLSA